MIRDVKLIDYLPQFVQEYREIRKIMDVENPEIQMTEDETEIILNNQFIETCNVQGIAKFESLMGIIPSPEDTLEGRISRVLTRWNDVVPYTFIVLCRKLNTLCGDNNYEIERNINEYSMDITTHLELSGQVDELDYLLDYIIPANIVITSNNKMMLNIKDGKGKLASGITFTNLIELTDNFDKNFEIQSKNKIAGGISDTAIVEITDNFNKNFEINGQNNIGSNISLTEII